MRLRKENMMLRELARIAPNAEVPKLPEFAWVKACDILTDAEREAIECFARMKWNTNGIEYQAATLRTLLERMK